MENLRSEGTGPTLTKQCRTCDEVKPLESFYKDKSALGRKTQCSACQSEYKMKRRRANKEVQRHEHFKFKYGITLDQWNDMYADQLGRCKICTVVMPSKGRGVHTDHSHTHGEVRGILCGTCNTSLGGFRDNPNTLRAAAEYIETDVEKHYEVLPDVRSDSSSLFSRIVMSCKKLCSRGRCNHD